MTGIHFLAPGSPASMSRRRTPNDLRACTKRLASARITACSWPPIAKISAPETPSETRTSGQDRPSRFRIPAAIAESTAELVTGRISGWKLLEAESPVLLLVKSNSLNGLRRTAHDCWFGTRAPVSRARTVPLPAGASVDRFSAHAPAARSRREHRVARRLFGFEPSVRENSVSIRLPRLARKPGARQCRRDARFATNAVLRARCCGGPSTLSPPRATRARK